MKRARGHSWFLAALLTGCAAAPGSEPSRPEASPIDATTAPAHAPASSAQGDAPASARPHAESAPASPPAAPAETAYATPLLDERALAATVQRACEEARASERPVLLEFSAPWCGDCLVLERLKQTSPLADELAHWQLLAINVGSGDEHPALMRAFRVRAIAKLVVLSPSRCSAPIESWPRGGSRTLDGLRQRADGASSELSTWLARARASVAAR